MVNGQVFGGLPTVTQADIIIQNLLNPGIQLIPSPLEIGGLKAVVRNISGSIYQMVNADLDSAGNFAQKDPTKSSSALVVTFTGAVVIQTAPANAPYPLVWTTSGSLFTQSPYFYIGFYGAPTDGITDAVPAWNRAVAAATANGGGTVLLGPYKYNFLSQGMNNGSNVNCLGMGEGTTVINMGFVASSSNPSVLQLGPASSSCEYSHFSIKGPGNGAIGAVPGPSTIAAPQLGYGWGILNFGGASNHIERVTISGCYHGIGGIAFSAFSIQNCTFNMGGPQTSPQYAISAQGRAGTDAIGQGVITGTPTVGDTLGCIFNDGQGTVVDTGPYTLTDSDAANGVNGTTLSFQSFLNASDAVNDPDANWLPVQASGNQVNVAIPLPAVGTTPTYNFYATGSVIITPTGATAVTGGTLGGNPQSFPFSVKYCNVPQAQLGGGGTGKASTEGVHIDGGVQSWNVDGMGTTGVRYSVRVANVNSGNSRNSSLCSIKGVSSDHTRVSAISLENGGGCDIRDCSIIAGYGGGPPVVNYAIAVLPTYNGGATIRNCSITNCAGGGIGMGANGLIEGCRINAVGKGVLSCINVIGGNDITGLMIRGNKLGTPNLANFGGIGGTQRHAIDVDSTFTGTLRSFTIEGNDIEGRGQALAVGTTLAAMIAALGNKAYWTIRNNPGAGLGTVTGISYPTVPAAGATVGAVNPFATECTVELFPAVGTTITATEIFDSFGNHLIYPSGAASGEKVTVHCPAHCSLLPVYASGSLTWVWQPHSS